MHHEAGVKQRDVNEDAVTSERCFFDVLLHDYFSAAAHLRNRKSTCV